MSYAVKEMFLTLQGEGVQAGRRAVFLRFAGCNLWSGREQDRASAICRFCDTDFVGTDGLGGGKFADADSLADAALGFWGDGREGRYIVLTGGEPMLQIDDALVDALHARHFTIAIESNGTLPVHPGVDWICISPKAGSDVVQRSGHELKLVWPQPGGGHSVAEVDAMAAWPFDHHLIQPLDDVRAIDNARSAIALVMERPQWRLTVQAHKYLGLR
ncbi:7-carboxy-7-deazaguanine synthase [Sphingobium sp. CCH11-B1]|jgi:7-carboxy-7-deazaguanine synthase (Cx14CxxC type)|uniref:7-carboxy-7-deazaguanine synthase n=1 Tax=Sphingobium sp. CCH11-B1 TaxID=1768781 RepID=UPI0008307151|nr:7-carboxy-7-deazaguanine synthase [Sphingobium sp. CCH11-B1]MEA3387724.1 7-carboxy-7-deazaguanine synthase [Pseudomonadota bacterium]